MRSQKPVSFAYASGVCQSVRGTLVTISDQAEQGEQAQCDSEISF